MMSAIRLTGLVTRAIRSYVTKRPLSASFEVIHSCNINCHHCNWGGFFDERLASPEQLGLTCRTLRPVIVNISGGEPLLRRDLERVVQEMRKGIVSPYVVVITNGLLLSRKRYQQLRQAGVDRLSLSLDYPDERHDAFRMSKGLFRHIERVVAELEPERSKPITLSCVVQKDNFRDLLRLAELAHRWNVDINFSAYSSLKTGDKRYLLSKDELPELKDVINRVLTFGKTHRCVFTTRYVFQRMIEFFEHGSVPNCRAGERFLVVNPDSTYSPCCFIPCAFRSQEQMRQEFTRSNTCGACITSMRVNTEKPISYLVRDLLDSRVLLR